MADMYDSDSDSEYSDYDVDSDAESVCSTTSSFSQHGTQPSFKVFVNYPPFVKREEIKDHLRSCGLYGNVKRLNMFYDASKRSKGSGYVEFVPQDFGKRAIGILNNSPLLGKHQLRAKKYVDRRKKGSPKHDSGMEKATRATSPPDKSSLCKVFVGAGVGRRLPDSIKSSDLEQHLRAFKSALSEVVIATDPRTDQSKGYGFVFFKSRRSADVAIKKLDGSSLHGCKLSFELSRPKEDHVEVSSAPSAESSGTKVFVGALVENRLPHSIRNTHLKAHLWKFERTLEEAVIIMDPDTQQSKGYGFAMFKTRRAAEAAIRDLNGSTLHGCELKLDIAKPSRGQSEAYRYSCQNQSATTREASGKTSGNRVHVKAQSGRLPNSIQSVHLEAHFWEFEQTLEEAFILSDPTTKQSRGFGFAVFKSKRAAEAAIRKLDGSVLHECQLKLEMARPKEEADSVNSSSQRPSNTVLEETGKSTVSVPSSSDSSTQYKVFVGNLQHSVQTQDLQEHFSAYESDIENVYIFIPSGKPTRCGFVVFSSYEATERAISALNGTKLHGRKIRVQHDKHTANQSKPSPSPDPQASSQLDLGVPSPLPQAPSLLDIKVPSPDPHTTSLLDLSVPSADPQTASLLDLSVPSPSPQTASLLDLGVPSMLSQPLIPPATVVTPSNTILLTNLNPEIDEETVKALCKGSVTDLKFVPVSASSKQAVITFSCSSDAQNAISDFSGKVFLGQKVSASLQRSVSTEQPQTGGHLLHPAEHTQVLFSLSAAQCNLLTAVNPGGSSLYQELIRPFKSNPNVKIELLLAEVSIQFSGQRAAVEDAQSYFKSYLQRHIPIEPECVQTLMEIHPQFAQQMAQNGVSLMGLHEKSKMLKLDGPASAVAQVRESIDMMISGFQQSVVQSQVPFTANLLASAKKRLRGEGIAARVCCSTPRKVVIYSFTQDNHTRAVKVLSSKPPVSYVPFQAGSSLKQIPLEDLQVKFSVTISPVEEEEKLCIAGFVKDDVTLAREKLSSYITKCSIQSAPLAISSDHLLYLQQKLKCDRQAAIRVLNELPAKVLIDPHRAPQLKGTPESIEQSQKLLLEGPLLCGLQLRSFVFTATEKFFNQLEKHILRPIKRENPSFEYLISESDAEPSPRKGRRSSARGKEKEATITVFSQEPEVFDDAVMALDEVTPCVRILSITHSNAIECVQENTERLERQYRVRVVVPSESTTRVSIFGLTESEAGQCCAELKECIDSTVEAEKYLKISHNQVSYFKQKKNEEWEELRGMCQSLRVFDKDKQEKETALIHIKGTVRQVRTTCQRLGAMMELDYYTRKFSVAIERKYNRMWLKFWETTIKEREEQLDLIVVVTSPRKPGSRSTNTSSTEDKVDYDFSVCGGDEDGTAQVEKELSNPQTVQKVCEKSELAIVELEKGKKEKKLSVDQYFVDISISVKEKKVVLTAPASCRDDLQAVEVEIERYISKSTLAEREITVSDPVLALIFNSKSKASPHLSVAKKLSEPHGVSVQSLRYPQCGLRLRGSQDSLDLVEPLIRREVITVILSTIDEIKFPVNSSLLPFFTSPDYVHFSAKIRDELNVLCTYPKARGENKVLKSAYLKTATSEYRIKLEICQGDITNEEVDAVVNAANEDLKHIGGLAKSILEAGGSSVQFESDMYIMEHGKLKPGNVACLGAGDLACKRILHAVGPRWIDGRHGEEQTLHFTVLSCLKLCLENGLTSVAFPAISTGIFAVPDHICMEASIKAIRDFCQVTTRPCITNIRLVLLQSDVAHTFSLALDSDLLYGTIVPTSKPVSSPVGHTWEWMDDSGSFLPYQEDINVKLNEKYGNDPINGAISFGVGKHSYVVHFSTMLQTNVRTKVQRKIRRAHTTSSPSSPTPFSSTPSPSSPTPIQWKFLNDSNLWTSYKPSESQAIEEMYQAQVPRHTTINGRVYTFDFARMCQINTDTSYKRPIQRSSVTTAPVASVPDQQPLERKEKKVMITLRGSRTNLTVAKKRLDEKLESALASEELTFPGPLEEKVRSILQQYRLEFDISLTTEKKGKNRHVSFKGLSSSVSKATSAIQEDIINYHIAVAEQSVIEVPQEWQPQTQNLLLCAVDQGTPEWNAVVGNFQRTLPTVAIVKVTRIQNKWLWERYMQHKQRLSLKNNGRVNEKELFHGTRSNDPKLIYEGEDGFDMRYSSPGMWGLANYFAANASYSDRYAYSRAGGYKEMFMVKVLTGDSYSSPSNQSLRMPPEKPVTVSENLQFAKAHYDTVTGTTHGCQVFMTYDNDKAYPAYLIQYI